MRDRKVTNGKCNGPAPFVFNEQVRDIMIECGKQGMSVAETAAELGISRASFTNYKNPKHASYDEDFATCWQMAKTHSSAWWHRKGREATFGEIQGFNAASYMYITSNMFPDEFKKDRKHEESIVDLGMNTDGKTELEVALEVIKLTANGTISPAVANMIVNTIKSTAEIKKTTELEQRIKELEDLANVGDS